MSRIDTGMGPQLCPCGKSDKAQRSLAYTDCCGRYVDHFLDAPALDAESLMRSRYSAFVLGRTDYLAATWHATTRPHDLAADPGTRWLGLEVRRYAAMDASHAEVEFVARYRPPNGAGPAVRIHERSRFVCEAGRWYYVDGDLL